MKWYATVMTILTITLSFLFLFLTLCSPVFAQSNSLDSVLKNAQKSLDNQSSLSTRTSQISKNNAVSIPKNSDIFVQTQNSYNSKIHFRD